MHSSSWGCRSRCILLLWRCRELHKEVVAGIDEAMARHAQETDKVDLLTLKKLKERVNVLEQQIVTDKARQLTVSCPMLHSFLTC